MKGHKQEWAIPQLSVKNCLKSGHTLVRNTAYLGFTELFSYPETHFKNTFQFKGGISMIFELHMHSGSQLFMY